MDLTIRSVEQLRETANGYRAARIIQAAAHLRLFDHLDQPITLDDLAKQAGLSRRGTDIIVCALVSLGLIELADGKYWNTPLAADHLTTRSKSPVVRAMDHAERLYRRWALLPEAIQEGAVDRPSSQDIMDDKVANRAFISAMHAHSSARAGIILEHIDLTGVRTAIDVGGGAGTFLIELIRRIPGMKGILIDRDLTLQTAGSIIAESGFDQQIELMECDIFEGTTPFGSDIDLAVLSNILHIEGPEKNILLLKRIQASLKPGGRLLLLDFFTDKTGTEPQHAAVFSVNMLTATPRGRAWRSSEVTQWIREAGFSNVKILDTPSDADVWIVK
jgi:3-hydroxy-5-methyl-1-naphthoate 3-O-methyltransferase